MMTRQLVLVVFGILVLGSVCLLTGCAGGPPAAVESPVTHYDLINPDYNWAALQRSIDNDDILLIERVDGQLGILKEEHRSGRRARSVVHYAGAVVKFDRLGSTSALAGHRLVGLGSDPSLVNGLARIGADLSRLSSDLRGLAIVIDSVDELTDSQLKSFVSAPAKCLVLDGLHYVTTEQATIIAQFKGRAISLNEVMWIGCPQIRELAKFAGEYLSLNSVQTLSDEQAHDLCCYKDKTVMIGNLGDESKSLLDIHRTPETATIITSLD